MSFIIMAIFKKQLLKQSIVYAMYKDPSSFIFAIDAQSYIFTVYDAFGRKE